MTKNRKNKNMKEERIEMEEVFCKKYKKATIYGILINDNTIYIGQTIDLKNRISSHKREIKKGSDKEVYKLLSNNHNFNYFIIKEVDFKDRILEETNMFRFYENKGYKVLGRMPYQK